MAPQHVLKLKAVVPQDAENPFCVRHWASASRDVIKRLKFGELIFMLVTSQCDRYSLPLVAASKNPPTHGFDNHQTLPRNYGAKMYPMLWCEIAKGYRLKEYRKQACKELAPDHEDCALVDTSEGEKASPSPDSFAVEKVELTNEKMIAIRLNHAISEGTFVRSAFTVMLCNTKTREKNKCPLDAPTSFDDKDHTQLSVERISQSDPNVAPGTVVLTLAKPLAQGDNVAVWYDHNGLENKVMESTVISFNNQAEEIRRSYENMKRAAEEIGDAFNEKLDAELKAVKSTEAARTIQKKWAISSKHKLDDLLQFCECMTVYTMELCSQRAFGKKEEEEEEVDPNFVKTEVCAIIDAEGLKELSLADEAEQNKAIAAAEKAAKEAPERNKMTAEAKVKEAKETKERLQANANTGYKDWKQAYEKLEQQRWAGSAGVSLPVPCVDD